MTFSDVERQFYESRYSNFVESQNERNAKIRHTERNRSIPDLLSSRKTCPEETIYQLGTLDEHASAEDLLNIVTEFIDEFKAKYGEHVHVLDWALHLDESTPHIHERHVFDCENKYGEVAPQQEKALEALGFDLPDPGKPLSRRNNRKITFDAACRKMLFEIAKRHGLDLEEEAEYGNRKYLEKQDFILAKQKEQLAAQQSKLDELTLKVSDMETLLEDVSAALVLNKEREVVYKSTISKHLLHEFFARYQKEYDIFIQANLQIYTFLKEDLGSMVRTVITSLDEVEGDIYGLSMNAKTDENAKKVCLDIEEHFPELTAHQNKPRISNGTHKARSRFNTVIVRRGPTKSDGRDGRTGRYRNRKRKSTAAFVFNARLAASFTRRTRHARRPRGFFHPTEAGTAPLRPNRTAAAPRTVRPYRCRPNKATKRRAKIIDSFRASAPNDARKRLPFVTRQARISAKQ